MYVSSQRKVRQYSAVSTILVVECNKRLTITITVSRRLRVNDGELMQQLIVDTSPVHTLVLLDGTIVIVGQYAELPIVATVMQWSCAIGMH